MFTKNRILLDRIVAGPVAAVLNLAAAALGKVARRDHSRDAERTSCVAVAKLVGLGAIVQTTPLLRALRARFPKARLVFVTLKANRELITRLNLVDEIVCLDDSSPAAMARSTTMAIVTLIRRRVDHYLDLELYSRFAGVLAICSLARNRAGFYRYTARFRLGIYTDLVYFNTRYPIRRTYLQLGQVFGASAAEDSLSAPVVSDSDLQALFATLPDLPLSSSPRLIVNANASDLMHERRWPIENFARVVDAMARLGAQVILIGAPSETSHVALITRELSEDVRSLVIDSSGRLSVSQLISLLSTADAVLTNDSGPMHIAIALSRPTICLFGPAHPDQYGIEGSLVTSFYAAVPCSPCVHEVDEPPCKGDNVCMQRIMPEMVEQTLKRVLRLSADEPVDARLPLVWNHPEGKTPLATLQRPQRPTPVPGTTSVRR